MRLTGQAGSGGGGGVDVRKGGEGGYPIRRSFHQSCRKLAAFKPPCTLTGSFREALLKRGLSSEAMTGWREDARKQTYADVAKRCGCSFRVAKSANR